MQVGFSTYLCRLSVKSVKRLSELKRMSVCARLRKLLYCRVACNAVVCVVYAELEFVELELKRS